MDYPDTSFLCALYRVQDNSDRAIAARASLGEVMTVAALVLWEFRNAARFQVFRFRQDRRSGYSQAVADKMMKDLSDDLDVGILRLVPIELSEIFVEGERLSREWTASGGHRGFDTLHVATALLLGAEGLLTFDENQARLARACGLATPLF